MAGSAIENLGGSIKVIADYEIVKKLGQGGMGSVFLARQISLDRQVALKVISPSFADNKDFIARFQREARAVGNLNHPNIVQGIDVGRDEKTGLWHFAMEFVNGPSVSRLVKDGPLPEERALKIGQQIAQALDFAHKRGFVHRDIKPDNILLTSSGDAKLADLGLAKHTESDASLTQTGMAVGSPHYISPEQARGDATLDIRSDIYSLGVTLFHMVTGKTPFDGPTAAVIMVKHLNDDVPDARTFNPKISEPCGKLIARMTRRDRNQRFKTPAELADAIERVLSGQEPAEVREPVTARAPRAVAEGHGAPTRSPAKPREKKQSDAMLFAGIGGAVLLGVVAWMFLGQGNREAERSAEKKAAAAAPELPKPEAEAARPPPRMDAKPPPAPAAAMEAPKQAPRPVELPPAPVNIAVQPAPAAPVIPPPANQARPALDASKLNAVLDRFDAEAMKNNNAEASRIAKDATADAALSGFAKELHDLSDLAQALSAEDASRVKALQALKDGKPHTLELRNGREAGTVEKITDSEIWLFIDFGGGNGATKKIKLSELSDAERKRLDGGYKPATLSEHLAAAIHALESKDIAAAKNEVAAAAGDSLCSHYLEKIHELEVAQLEKDAAKAFVDLHLTGAAPANAQAAQDELKKLDEFERQFGQTRFAASVADKIQAAKALALKVLGFVSGVFINKSPGNDFIEFKADGAKNSERYAVDAKNPDIVAAIARLITYRRARLQLKDVGGQKSVVGTELLPPPDKQTGEMHGKVSEINTAPGVFPYIEIQNDTGEYERFAPGNHGKDTPIFPGMVAKVKPGDTVKVQWVFETRMRLVKVE